MLAKVTKWGNSQGVRFSKNFLKDAKLSVGDNLIAHVDENHAILLRRVPKTPSERFMEVFGNFQGDGRCHEDSFSRDVGREVVE